MVVLSAEKEKTKEEDPESRSTQVPSTPPLSDSEDFTGLETTSLLQHEDTVLHISEDNGMENPLLSSQFSFTHVEVGQTDVDPDESHVWGGQQEFCRRSSAVRLRKEGIPLSNPSYLSVRNEKSTLYTLKNTSSSLVQVGKYILQIMPCLWTYLIGLRAEYKTVK